MNINSISEYLDILYKVNNSSEQIYYRGHSDVKYLLKPNLYREEGYYVNEDSIYKETIVNSPHEFYNCHTAIEVLVKMQHYGIPTRLLDVTENPLVALFFACHDNLSKNGEVVVLNIPNKNVRFYDSDKVTIIANIAKQQVDFGFDYKPNFDYNIENDVSEVNNKYFGYLLHSIRHDKPHFYDIINPKHIESVYGVKVKLDNPRIIKQNGAFLIFGVKKSIEGMSGKTHCAEVNNKWIIKPDNQKIIIPKKSKNTILKELNLLGINYSSLFPELSDFAKYIRNKYN